MRAANNRDKSRLIAACMQKVPCDLTIENVQFVNVITGEIYPASVDVLDGTVVRVREEGEGTSLRSAEVYDGRGAYLIPGFFDTHVHCESTMMIPENFGRAILPWGTTTVVTDPHEIANVMGLAGVEFMLENAARTPLRQYVLAPSCVPSVPALEGAGAVFCAPEIARLLDTPGVIGIAEIMDYVNVVKDEERMRTIIAEGDKRGVFLQGHAPGLGGKELDAYLLAGPVSDHECRSPEESARKLRAGMHVNLKSSSLSDFLAEAVKGLAGKRFIDNVSLCTDDIHAKDILETGHINRVVRKAVQCGVEPIDAIRFATYNAAREYGFADLGAIAPGYVADIQLVRELDGEQPVAVFAAGKLVAENGKYLAGDGGRADLSFPNTMDMPQIGSADDFVLRAPEGCGSRVKVNVVHSKHNGGFNKNIWEELPVTEGKVDISDDPDLAFVAVCNRYGSGAKALTVMRNFGIAEGAYASTVSHDSHNFCVVYKNAGDAFAAAEQLGRTGGGMCVASGGAVRAVLELPVAGVMSTHPVGQLAAEVTALENAVRAVCGGQSTFHKIAPLALVVLPGTLVSDKGIVDGPTQAILPVFDR